MGPQTYERAKRSFDIIVALTGIALLWPLFLAVASVIRIDSPGPILYRGVRVGKNGILFRIYKFRTMTPGAETQGTTTHLNDTRVTRVGSWLRKYKLDELPQLINVLKGEMSIVGPRPEVEEHTSEYAGDELAILSVCPGITDFASVRFVDMASELGTVDPHGEYVTRVRHEKNQLRLKYVRTRSFAVDLQIVALTAWTLAKKLVR